MLSDHLISCKALIIEALSAINRLPGDVMTLFVTDAAGRITGTLTDGDIRRALIAGVPLDAAVELAAHTAFRSLRPGSRAFDVVKDARAAGITLLPRIDADGFPEGIVDLRVVRSMLPVDAVLMAGGRGERLRPLTLDCPKPLLKVGGKAIIDYNIDELKANGVERIFVTVNYLREQIEEHFDSEEGVDCVAEPMRLGTMGSLSLVAPELRSDNVIVMNSDLLTDLSFEDMYAHHEASGAALTVAAVQYPVSVPFAIMQTEADRVVGLSEKPTYNYYANAGVYILRRELVGRIPASTYVDAPDFIGQLIEEGAKVSYFPIQGTWIDIGSPDDFRYACELMSRPGRDSVR